MIKTIDLLVALVALILICLMVAIGIVQEKKLDVAIKGSMLPAPPPLKCVRVCSAKAEGFPCVPLMPVYADEKRQVAITNPFMADPGGKFTVFLEPGVYKMQFYECASGKRLEDLTVGVGR